MMPRVYIGFDQRGERACRVARKTLLETSGVEPEWLYHDRLRDAGLLQRPTDLRDGQRYDIVSNAPCATEFSLSRFMVPLLCQSGWALFTDCDVVFMRDVREIFQHCDQSKAVMCVKHDFQPTENEKMVGTPQTRYDRKGWSSVCLFNCEHPANRRLSLRDVNERTGLALHGFYWLHDVEIGALPSRANWLVNEQPRPDGVIIAHFTRGGPWLPEWPGAPNDDIWMEAAR